MILAACVVLTAGLFYFIFFGLPARVDAGQEKTRLAFLLERKEAVYENLRDLNFEHRAGKLPDADYHALRAGLEDEAAALLAEIDLLEKQAERAARPLTSDPKGAKI